MYDFTIIGGGYGGLSAAALLSKRGKSVLLVEQSEYLGGRSFYFEEDGFIWQYGQHSHRLERDGIAYQVFERLGDPLEFIDVGKGDAQIFYKGRLFKRPEGLFGFLSTKALSRRARLSFIKFYIKLLKQDPYDWYDKTLQQFYRTFFDDRELEEFISLLGFTIMLPDITAVSAGEVIDFIRRVKKSKVKQGEPLGGAKQVIDKLKKAIEDNGGEIRVNERVKGITVKESIAQGILTEKNTYESKNVVYAAPLNNLFDLVNTNLFDQDFVNYCKNIESSSGVVIDYVSKEPLSDLKGGIIGVDIPLWVKFQTNIDSTVAPEGNHFCTWGLLIERGRSKDPDAIAETEKRLREVAEICMPGYREKVIRERKLIMPVINANMLIPSQSKPHRPKIMSQHIENLYFVGDTTRGDGCSGDIAFSSALKLDDMIE